MHCVFVKDLCGVAPMFFSSSFFKNTPNGILGDVYHYIKMSFQFYFSFYSIR